MATKEPKAAAGAGKAAVPIAADDSDEDVSRVADGVSEKSIKRACRLGLTNAERAVMWVRLAGATNREDYYLAALEKVFGAGNIKPSKVYRVPFLGVEPMALPPSATELMHQPSISLSAAHDRVVCVLAQLYGLRYCPMLSNLGLLLLRHLSESLTFSVLETLLKDNREEWFQKTWEDEVAFVNTFQDVLESRHPKLATHLESLGGGTFSFYGSWFRSFFVGWITSEDTFNIVDCYLSEGPKVLIRFGIAFLKLCSKELMKAMSDNDVEDILREFVSLRGFPGKYSFESLSKEAFSVRNFSRKTVYQLYEKHRAMIGDLKVEDEDLMATAYRHPSIWYNPKLLGHRSKLLERAFRLLRSVARKARSERAEGKGEDDGFVDSDIERDEEPEEKKAELDGSEDPTDGPTTTLSVAASPQLSALMSWLPESVSLCDWTLVYSTQVHARNLSAFYSKAKLIGPTLMLLQTQVRRSGEETALGPSASPVFGFYCSKSMAPTSKRAPNWVGSLDSFLFQILPDLTVTGVTTAATAISMAASRIRKDKAVDLRSNYSGTVLRGDHFVLATPSSLAIGGNPVTTEVAFRMGTDMLTCEMSADILRDLGVFSLLRVSPETSEHGIVGDAPSAGGGSAGAGAGDGVPKMGSIPAPERPVILDLLDLELFGFADVSGNFLTNDDAAPGPTSPKPATPGKDGEGWW